MRYRIKRQALDYLDASRCYFIGKSERTGEELANWQSRSQGVLTPYADHEAE